MFSHLFHFVIALIVHRRVMGMNTGECKYRIGPFAVPLKLE